MKTCGYSPIGKLIRARRNPGEVRHGNASMSKQAVHNGPHMTGTDALTQEAGAESGRTQMEGCRSLIGVDRSKRLGRRVKPLSALRRPKVTRQLLCGSYD